jgi:hypothetical protein
VRLYQPFSPQKPLSTNSISPADSFLVGGIGSPATSPTTGRLRRRELLQDPSNPHTRQPSQPPQPLLPTELNTLTGCAEDEETPHTMLKVEVNELRYPLTLSPVGRQTRRYNSLERPKLHTTYELRGIKRVFQMECS